MKESRYNIFAENNGQTLVFNSRTVAMAVMDEEALQILELLRNGEDVTETELTDAMKYAGFVIEDNIDELQQIEMNFNLNKYQKNGLSLVIAPTMACNFACPYCFEHSKAGVMSEEIQEEIISMVTAFAKEHHKIDITWFGGEPLLAQSIISNMSRRMIEICDEEDVGYEARIITNGYLVNKESLAIFKECRINFAQITLDGIPETHNKRKKLKCAPDVETFDVIIKNMKSLKTENIRLAVRFNIDKQNMCELNSLLEIVIENDLVDDFHLGHVQSGTDNNKGFAINCLNTNEFARLCAELEDLLYKKKIKTSYPIPLQLNCGACYLYSYVIDPKGAMCKCWNDIGVEEKSIGNIASYDNKWSDLASNPNKIYATYMNWSPFIYKKCKECKILPICMGGCQYNGMLNDNPICDHWKYELKKYLKLKAMNFEQ